jgi:hypothetical protein
MTPTAKQSTEQATQVLGTRHEPAAGPVERRIPLADIDVVHVGVGNATTPWRLVPFQVRLVHVEGIQDQGTVDLVER